MRGALARSVKKFGVSCVFLARVQKRTLTTIGELSGSEHNFSIVTNPPIMTARFIA
jgi:hypothetical protein